MEAGQELAPVQRQRPLVVPGIQCRRERHGIAPQRLARDPDLPRTPVHDHVPTEPPAQHVQRLVQRAARPVRIALRPEHRQHRVAAAEPARAGQREVQQQREPLRLLKNRLNAAPVWPLEIEPSYRGEPNHSGNLAR